MASYNEVGSGGAKMRGCGVVEHIHVVATTFGPGDVLYSIYKARRGILEKVVIKYAKIIKNKRTGGQYVFLYVDTLNALWNEYDLVPYSQAYQLAQNYLADLQEDFLEADEC